MRYLLPGDTFRVFKKEIMTLLARFTSGCGTLDEIQLLEEMGFPINWKDITRYKTSSKNR
ncbi:MAG: hypothetical protein RSC90_11485 [Clostridia bacterium]